MTDKKRAQEEMDKLISLMHDINPMREFLISLYHEEGVSTVLSLNRRRTEEDVEKMNPIETAEVTERAQKVHFQMFSALIRVFLDTFIKHEAWKEAQDFLNSVFNDLKPIIRMKCAFASIDELEKLKNQLVEQLEKEVKSWPSTDIDDLIDPDVPVQ